MDESQNVMLSKGSQTYNSTYIWFHLHETLEKTNLIFRDRSTSVVVWSECEYGRLNGKGHEGIDLGDGYVLYLTVIVVYIFLKPYSTVYLKCTHFILHKLHLSKVENIDWVEAFTFFPLKIVFPLDFPGQLHTSV